MQPQVVGWLHGAGCGYHGRLSAFKRSPIQLYTEPVRQVSPERGSEGWYDGICLEDHIRYHSAFAGGYVQPPGLVRSRAEESTFEENRSCDPISPVGVDVFAGEIEDAFWNEILDLVN